jgi:hypothetical protein
MQKEQDNKNNNSWSVVNGNKKRNGRRNNKTPRDRKPKPEPEPKYRSSRWDIPQNEQKTNISEQKTLVPTKPTINYSSIASNFSENKNNVEEYTCTNDTEYHPFPTILIRPLRTRPSVRGTNPKPNHNVSYDVWEYTYFKNIIELSDIFLKGFKQLGINTHTNMEYEDYIDFLHLFGQFIRDCSSGEISPYIEELSSDTNDFYKHFTILRNEV